MSEINNTDSLNTAKKPNKKKKKSTNPAIKVLKIFGTLLLSIFLVVIITCSIFATVLTIYVLNFADTTTTVSLEQVQTSNITRFLATNNKYDKTNSKSQKYNTYYTIKNENKKVQWTSLENIPQYVQDAFVYTEDERFYSHNGVDYKRTFAAFVNVFIPIYGGRSIGGSTITQQTIKNITGDAARSGIDGAERKIREIFRTINVEKSYTKEDILQSYLNIVPLPTQKMDIIGVQAAANFYFGKDVSKLNLAEAASLAGMTTAPADNNPYDSFKYNKIRQKYTLDHMLSNGAISEQEYDEALAYKLKVTGDADYSSTSEYSDDISKQGATSYFMDEALTQAENAIADSYGITTDEAHTKLYNGGFNVYTTVDTDMQTKVEKAMQTQSNFTTYSMAASKDNLLSGFIAMDYNGNVKAVVGGRKKKTKSRIFNIATDAERSPGSCIKPIASYAPALDQDLLTWSSKFVDEPITIKVNNKSTKWPVNYSEVGGTSNWSYQNLYTWEMLMRSLNTLPAQLIKKMTPSYSYNFLKEKLDITTLKDADNNYSPVTVGGLTNGLHLSELVGAYMIFGNGGKKYDLSYISKITDAEGKTIYEKSNTYKQAISESTSYIMNRLLQNVINNTQGTGRQAKLNKTDLVGKTGTSSAWNDLSFVGCSPDYVSGVWIGYDTLKSIPTTEYQNIAAIWKNIFGDIVENETHHSFDDTFKMPSSVEKLNYCRSSGKLASNGCSNTSVGYYKKTNKPSYCTLGY